MPSPLPAPPGAVVGALLAPLLLSAPLPAQEATSPERGVRVHLEGTYDGLTLFSPLLSHDVYLVDLDGRVVHRWETQHAPAGSVYLLPDGHLLRGAREDDNPRFDGGGIGGRVQELDWDGNVVWDYVLADDYQTSHHDVEPLPNGNLLVIAWEHRFADDVIEAGRDPAVVLEEGLWPDAVLELRPVPPDDAEVVWEWHAWDHLAQDSDPDKPRYGSPADHPGRIDINVDHRDRPPLSAEERRKQEELEQQMRALGYVGGDDEDEGEADGAGGGGRDPQRGRRSDWLHTNAVDYHPELDLIVLSTPNLNELWIIDHSTSTEQARGRSGGRWGRGGELLWRWGNPRNYGAGTDAHRRLFYQHDPQFVLDGPAGELRLTVYNNGGGRPGGDRSSVDELLLPFDPARGFLREPGQAFGPAEPAWSYEDPGTFFSGFISGAQRLPNGNTLICQGADGRVFEVSRAGAIVWEYWNEHGGDVQPTAQAGNAPPKALFRATRIARDDPRLRGRL